ncbi:MerR family transcriptional regulator [Pseudonocardia pini]|uniref:MerR family transcriptional regulator n=1 Tax=Pseudonocardia pini TaxID=2758030 RepID=UPI0015F0CF9C|nr:MerR family transcriptional regulator [Pseudonocardia pini]
MRMAELSRTTGVPVATIKYYVREGLLPRGEVTTSPNQASYGEQHVRRLQLVRSLVEVGGLSIAAVRATLAAVDDPAVPLHDTLGMTIAASDPATAPAPDDAAQHRAEARIDEVLAKKGWRPHPGASARQAAIDCLATMHRVTGDRLASVVDAYADAVEAIAEADLDTVSALADPEERVETALVGTVLGDRLLAALRRLAQEHVSARRFPPAPEETPCPPQESP